MKHNIQLKLDKIKEALVIGLKTIDWEVFKNESNPVIKIIAHKSVYAYEQLGGIDSEFTIIVSLDLEIKHSEVKDKFIVTYSAVEDKFILTYEVYYTNLADFEINAKMFKVKNNFIFPHTLDEIEPQISYFTELASVIDQRIIDRIPDAILDFADQKKEIKKP